MKIKKKRKTVNRTENFLMDVPEDVVDPVRVEGAGPADQSVDFIALGKEKFCQVRSVLAGDAGDECFFHGSLKKRRAES